MRNMLYVIICILSQLVGQAQTSDYLTKVGKKDSLYSETLKESRTIFVEVPESFNTNPSNKYPVIILLDGEVLFPIVSNVHQFYSGGFMPETILVGISNAENRTRDLTPTKISSKYGMPFSEENGEAENFLRFIETELIPHIEKNYPATNYRTLIGHSYGGLFSLYALIHKSQLFANYLSIDPSLDWDDQILLQQMNDVLSNTKLSEKSVYMSLSGQLHMQNPEVTLGNIMNDTTDFTLFSRSNLQFAEIMKTNSQSDLTFYWQFYPNDLHGTIPLPSIKDGLLETFKWFQMENTAKINNAETSKDELLKIMAFREAKLKKHFGYAVPPYPEFLLNMSGYMNLEMQQLDKSKMYFEQALQYYPESANAHDSMADYFEAIQNYPSAIKFVTKAYELSGSDYHKNRLETLNKK
tara:strand:+ start:31601 stop:32833 length:1233 start_codon:yes stop_codon:yes gene_type:complete